MRKAGPILIAVIGVLALIICFAPNLSVPDSSSPTGSRLIETRLGLDLQGGLRVEYEALPVDGQEPTPEDMAVMKDIVERRVNATGVSEAVVVVQGSDRIVVELPGVTNPEAVRQLVGQTGLLEFVPLGQTQVQEGQVLDLEAYPPLFGGDQVKTATIGQDTTGGLTVDFVLKDEGAKLFARLHRREHRRLLRDRPRRDRSSRRRSSRARSRTARSRSRPAGSAASPRPMPTTS